MYSHVHTRMHKKLLWKENNNVVYLVTRGVAQLIDWRPRAKRTDGSAKTNWTSRATSVTNCANITLPTKGDWGTPLGFVPIFPRGGGSRTVQRALALIPYPIKTAHSFGLWLGGQSSPIAVGRDLQFISR